MKKSLTRTKVQSINHKIMIMMNIILFSCSFIMYNADIHRGYFDKNVGYASVISEEEEELDNRIMNAGLLDEAFVKPYDKKPAVTNMVAIESQTNNEPIVIETTDTDENNIVEEDPIIEKEEVIPEPPRTISTMYINSDNGLNVRAEATTDSEVADTLQYAEKVEVYDDMVNGFYELTDGNGYISSSYVSDKEPEPLGTDLGEFKITAYCNCVICCSKWAGMGITASGAKLQAGTTVAVDPRVIPLGSHIIINGHEYIAQDTGSAVKGKVIDIYMGTHAEAKAFGCQHMDVQIIRK